MNRINNGQRARLTIIGVHDGIAGWQEPTQAQLERGATRVVAFYPSAARPEVGMTASGLGTRFRVVAVERSPRVRGLHILLLGAI